MGNTVALRALVALTTSNWQHPSEDDEDKVVRKRSYGTFGQIMSHHATPRLPDGLGSGIVKDVGDGGF